MPTDNCTITILRLEAWWFPITDFASSMLFIPQTFPSSLRRRRVIRAALWSAWTKKNIEPRIGFAYSVVRQREDRIARRIRNLHQPALFAPRRGTMVGGPFAGSVTYFNSVTNGVPLFRFPSPFLPTGTTAVQNVSGVNPNLKTPYTQQWNLTLEQPDRFSGLARLVCWEAAVSI